MPEPRAYLCCEMGAATCGESHSGNCHTVLRVPFGFQPVDVEQVFRRGNELVVLGRPKVDDDLPEDEQHNCDAMCCGSGSHVLLRATVTQK
jgi:hypothetical protein